MQQKQFLKFNPGANPSGDNGACQGAKTRPTADQVSFEKGEQTHLHDDKCPTWHDMTRVHDDKCPTWHDMTYDESSWWLLNRRIKGSRGEKWWKHSTVGSKRAKARFKSCSGKAPGVQVRQTLVTRWKRCNFRIHFKTCRFCLFNQTENLCWNFRGL